MGKVDKEQNYLITGCAGFIGFHLCKALIDKGCNVIGIDNINNYYSITLKEKRLSILTKSSNFKFYKIDISEKGELMSLFKEHNVDIVVNLAAQAGVRYSIENPDVYMTSNVIGFYNLLECCRRYAVKHLVYASSSSVYGNNNKIPFSEKDKVDNPISLYAASKKFNETIAYTYAQLYKIPATGLRFFTVYGPWGRPDMAYYSFTKNIVEGRTIKVFNRGDLYRDFTYIDDVIDGILTVIPNRPPIDINCCQHKIYNIGNNKPVKLLYFIEVLEKYVGEKAKKEFCPLQPGDVYKTYADISEIKNKFDFNPKIEIEVGLQRFVEWYKNEINGYI